MAGGRFDKLVGKVRPGTYINFESNKQEVLSAGTRGTCIIPICGSGYGPAKKFIKLLNSSPDAESATLGYSIYDKDPKRQMLLIREAFKNASTVYVYILTEGTKAHVEIELDEEAGNMTCTAMYGGTRGNDLTVTITENPVNGFDVTISLAGAKVAEYEGLTTAEELAAQGCAYMTFSGSGKLKETAGTNLAGGTDVEKQNTDVTTFIDDWEKIRFNTVAFPFDDEELKQAADTKIEYMRDSMGRGVQVVAPNAKKDYEGVINVTNSVALGDDELSVAEACAWVAGATAGAGNTDSLTYVKYEGATEVVKPKSHEEAVKAINDGEFFFSISEEGDVVVEYDINSLTTFVKPKDKTYRKNRVIRVFDTFADAIMLNFPPNKFDNESNGWDIMEGIGKTVLRQFDDAGAITNVDYENDFKVDREMSVGDETFFNVGLQPVDSAEKLYFTIATR